MHMIPYDPRKGYHTKNLNSELVAICMPHQKQSVRHSDKLENLQDVVFTELKTKTTRPAILWWFQHLFKRSSQVGGQMMPAQPPRDVNKWSR